MPEWLTPINPIATTETASVRTKNDLSGIFIESSPMVVVALRLRVDSPPLPG
jgi:hypothetical protein